MSIRTIIPFKVERGSRGLLAYLDSVFQAGMEIQTRLSSCQTAEPKVGFQESESFGTVSPKTLNFPGWPRASKAPITRVPINL